MGRIRSVRLGSFVLLLAFLGGGIGLPLYDAAVYHTRPVSQQPTVTAFGDGGGTDFHPQFCLQLQASGHSRALAADVPKLPGGADASSHAPLPTRSAPTTDSDLRLDFSRAPPLA